MQTVHAELYTRNNHWGEREDNRQKLQEGWCRWDLLLIHTRLTIDFTRAAIFRGFNKGGDFVEVCLS